MTTECRVCHGRADSFAHAQILGRYDIEYFRCHDCEFIQTETPYWLDEAYDSAIVSTDVGLVSRNEKFSRICDRVLRWVYPGAATCVDYGGGYGMFTRMMRDRGHVFSHFDPYCQNLFAKGFEAEPIPESNLKAQRFDLLTAFEVFEHMLNPQEDLKRLDAMADNWLISTMTVPEPVPQPHQWWYYVLDGGQHISLWSKRALQSVAAQYGRQLVTTRCGLNLFSAEKVNPLWVTQILRDRSVRILDSFRKRRSLLQDDFQAAVAATKRAA